MTREREGRQLDEVRQLALSYGEPDPSPDFPSPVTRLVPRSPTVLSDSELFAARQKWATCARQN
jgi:hypothetical protein